MAKAPKKKLTKKSVSKVYRDENHKHPERKHKGENPNHRR